MAESKIEPKAESKPAKLAPAGPSGDPVVHQLLAERATHVLNLVPDDPEVARRREAAQAAIDDIDKQLADLGFTAS